MVVSSRFWLGAEMLLIAAPLTALYAVGAAPVFIYAVGPFGLLIRLVIVAAATALASGWYLFYVFMRRGKPALNSSSPVWWSLGCVGFVLGLLSALSNYLPKSEPYSSLDIFRSDFGRFELGLLFGLPLVHLWFERGAGQLSNNRWSGP
jgi:hypothetical protein